MIKWFKRVLRTIYIGHKIEEHNENGYEIHSGPGWGYVHVVDKEKYMKYQSKLLSSIYLPRPK